MNLKRRISPKIFTAAKPIQVWTSEFVVYISLQWSFLDVLTIHFFFFHYLCRIASRSYAELQPQICQKKKWKLFLFFGLMYKNTEFRLRVYSHARRCYISKPAGSNGCLPLLQIQGAVGIRVCFLQLHKPRIVSRSLFSPRKGGGTLRFEECGHVCVCSRVCLNAHTIQTRTLSYSHTRTLTSFLDWSSSSLPALPLMLTLKSSVPTAPIFKESSELKENRSMSCSKNVLEYIKKVHYYIKGNILIGEHEHTSSSGQIFRERGQGMDSRP